MAIDPALLIAAPMLQDYFVDKVTGFPLVNGLVRLYQDNARDIFKNWYYQTGTPGSYTWIPLANPLYLSSVGTIQDPNNNDVIPFFYPYDDEGEPEPYYITVYATDINGDPTTLQFTRENFPYIAVSTPPDAAIATLRNYILNNVYWRNIGSMNLTSVLDTVVAPSQHEGYANNHDIRFLKSVSGSVDTISFIPMTQTIVGETVTPETQLSMTCTFFQAGETQKCIQYPVSLHVNTLSGVSGNLVINAQNISGNPNNYLDIYVYQFLGTGALIQPDPIIQQRIMLNNVYERFVVPIQFPTSADLALGPGGDDALFIQIGYPRSAIFGINHTKPQLYLSTDVPSNDFDTYDQIEQTINSPRTGDVKISLNSFQPFGFVPMNDGRISLSNVNSTPNVTRANIDTWPLFNLIWGAFQSSQSLAQMYTNAGSPTTVAYGSSAIADFMAGNQISLTKQAGRLIAGVGAPSSGTNTGTTWTRGQTAGNEQTKLTTGMVADHIHSAPPSSGGAGGFFFLQNAAGGAAQAPTGMGVTTSGATGLMDPNNPNPTPVPLQNPVAYQNIYMKL